MADLLLGGVVDAATHERTGAPTSISTRDLTTHGVIVGMTGSGKTGLGIVLIEECLAGGIPALLIDPKGDLTNLCLTFPDLRAEDFRPWIDDADAAKAGLPAEAYAAQQAEKWAKGLAGWGYGTDTIRRLRETAEITVYTPGSTAGRPINVVGSLQAPADLSDTETVADEVDGFVSGLLALVGIEADPLASREHILLANLVHHAWSTGAPLDLATLVGQVRRPPIRKLGVFDLDQFFPSADRDALAMRLNGLLASPSFAAWGAGDPIDVDALLRAPDGRPRAAIVTTAHLDDNERQFVTALLLSKVVTWMRRQSGTTDLRALVYMDEVAGYLPPTAMPPTKKPMMTMMKQARAFGLGVVLSTQNPVDLDYKALSNAGTWMIGRLQTERDKQRLLDGLSSASGGIDVSAVADTISGLAPREFVLRRAGDDAVEVFTTRWAMSYLRGPLTRDQIASLGGASGDASSSTASAAIPPAASEGRPVAAERAASADETTVMPSVAAGVRVAFVDPSAPWIEQVGGHRAGTRNAASIVARVALRYDDAKAGLAHDDEYEAVLFPLPATVDVSRAIAVDHDDRDLVDVPPSGAVYRLCDASIDDAGFWRQTQRDLIDHLVRSRPLRLLANGDLDLVSRPDETSEQFAARCEAAADARADAAAAKLRDTYEDKAIKLRQRIDAAEDRVEVLETQKTSRDSGDLLSTAGSILGGLLGGRRSRRSMVGSVLGKLGGAAGRRSRTAVGGKRIEQARDKVEALADEAARLEAELAEELLEIDATWAAAAGRVSELDVTLERADVTVTQLVLAWLPVA